jgi:hypothetical protein
VDVAAVVAVAVGGAVVGVEVARSTCPVSTVGEGVAESVGADVAVDSRVGVGTGVCVGSGVAVSVTGCVGSSSALAWGGAVASGAGPQETTDKHKIKRIRIWYFKSHPTKSE